MRHADGSTVYGSRNFKYLTTPALLCHPQYWLVTDSTTWHRVILISLSRFICTISPCIILSTT